MLQLPIMGTIHTLIKTQQLEMKWQQRKADPKMLKEGSPEERQIAQFREDAARMRKSNEIATIDGKLKAGQKISDDELEYLRVNCPDLYKKAMETAMEREQYRKELENCKTKEEVERLNTNKMQRFLSETKTIRSNPNIPLGKKVELLEQITRRMMAVKGEHVAFTGSPRYTALPREEEVEGGKKKKKAEAVVELPPEELPNPYGEQKPEPPQRESTPTVPPPATEQSETKSLETKSSRDGEGKPMTKLPTSAAGKATTTATPIGSGAPLPYTAPTAAPTIAPKPATISARA